MEQGQVSRWHVVDADEIWHFYGGAPLELAIYDAESRSLTRHVLDAPWGAAEPVAVVTSGFWQAARSLGEYSLLGCSVGPGFEFADFRFVSSLPGHEDHLVHGLQGWEGLL